MTDILINIVRWINNTPIVGNILGVLFAIGVIAFCIMGVLSMIGIIRDKD